MKKYLPAWILHSNEGKQFINKMDKYIQCWIMNKMNQERRTGSTVEVMATFEVTFELRPKGEEF